ncbi:hypothetical protein D9M72_456320 [compost metagenome]
MRHGAHNTKRRSEAYGLVRGLQDGNPGLLGTVNAHYNNVFHRLVPGLGLFGLDVLVVGGLTQAVRADQRHGDRGALRVCRECAADRAKEPANEAAPAAGAEYQQLGGFGHFQQHTGGVPVLHGGVNVDVVRGHLVQGLLEDGLRTFADHRVVYGGIAAVQAGRCKDRHGVCGHDMQGAMPALSFPGGPDEGALAVVGTVHAHHNPLGGGRTAVVIP